jgi:heme-degrading monooxygenase HmoA
MIIESNLSEEEVLRRAAERADDYRAVPGLVQKYYVKLDGENRYGGVLVWESKEALAAFQTTELAKTIPTTYGVKGAPAVELLEIFDVLRNAGPEAAAMAPSALRA